MRIVDRILSLLRFGPRSIKELQDALPERSRDSVYSTISKHKEKFVRLKLGVIGLSGRDEHLKEFPLYKKIFNVLTHGPVRLEHIYDALPEENWIAVRYMVNTRPEFIKVKFGVIGRRGRDEYLQDRYYKVKMEQGGKVRIGNLLKRVLSDGPKEFNDICTKMPYHSKREVIVKLSGCKDFERVGSCLWKLNA